MGVDSLCASYAHTGRPFDSWQCYHGVGHGFMYQHGGNLTKALTACNTLTPTVTADHCKNGVFMELFNNEILAEESSFINFTNPLASCAELLTGKSTCYFYAPTYLTQNMGYSHSEVMSLCSMQPVQSIHTCIRGVAAEAAKRNQSDLAKVASLCEQTGVVGGETACLSGIVGITINQTASVDKTITACNTLPEQFHTACVTQAESYRPLFYTQ